MNTDLSRSLVHWMAEGKLDARVVLPALRQLGPEPAPARSLIELLEDIATENRAELAPLPVHLREVCRQEALAARGALAAGGRPPPDTARALAGLPLQPPRPWREVAAIEQALARALTAAHDQLLAQAHPGPAPVATDAVRERCQRETGAALGQLQAHGSILGEDLLAAAQARTAGSWPEPVTAVLATALRDLQQTARERAARAVDEAPVPLPDTVDEAQALACWTRRWEQSADAAERRRLLDMLCAWPSPRAAAPLRDALQQGWMQERAQVALALRFGVAWASAWPHWHRWLEQCEREWRQQADALDALAKHQAVTLLWTWYQNTATPDTAALEWLRERAAEHLGPEARASFASRSQWAAQIPAHEQTRLGLAASFPAEPRARPYAAPGAVPPVIGAPAVATAATAESPAALPQPVPQPLPVSPPAPPPEASVWDQHIQPFFTANGYVLAGIAMVIVGSSLVAYYTWDKHWLVRYTIMPALLAFFTWTLARAGQWIEDRDPQFKAMGATLRGAAIGLLPVNFMAIGLLSGDPDVSHKGLAVSLMAAVYLGFFGWGLRRWCSAVHPGLGNVLGGALLALNALVAFSPLARTLGGLQGEPLWQLMGAGFHAGFAVAAAAVIWFSRRILTPDLAEEKRVPWFVGVALALTYAQVFAWVHAYMRHVPEVFTYAPAVVLAGGLVLFAEGVALRLQRAPRHHGAESFLGFALILLGLLMGAAQPRIRIVVFVLAGAVWLWQAVRREHPLHYGVALTLFMLGGASVTLLESFPVPWRPPVGMAMAVALMAAPRLAWARLHPEFGKACQGMQATVLMLTALVAVLGQWHESSAPRVTGVWLLLVGASFLWSALRQGQIAWLHTAMVVLALALPYLGCVQMKPPTLHHNTLPFGLGALSWLWLGATWIGRHPLLRQARSTVLCFYAVLAVAAMLLRVGLGDAAPDPLWYRDALAYLGPFLITGALVFATYYSRSHLLAAMGVAINVILFPELRGNLREALSGLAWGTGLGSALAALGLVALGFRLRPWARLRNLGDGDPLLGREPFPLRRGDHTLFTTPILLAALYLALRVQTWDLARNWTTGGVRVETAVALLFSGVVWLCIAAFWRAHRAAPWAVHLGWFWGAVGFGCWYAREAADPHWSWPLLLAGLWLQGLYWSCHYGFERRWPWIGELFTDRFRRVLAAGSLLVLGVAVADLVAGVEWTRLGWLLAFVAAQCAWHGLAKRQPVFGVALFVLLWAIVLAATAPGEGPLWQRMSVERSLLPTLGLLAAVQAMWLGLEHAPSLHARLEPLVLPMEVLSSALVCLLAVGALVDVVAAEAVPVRSQWVLLALMLMTARAHRSGPLLFLGLLLGYALVGGAELRALGNAADRIGWLTAPWRLGALALGMVLLLQAGRWLQGRAPRWLQGARPHPLFTAPSPEWVHGPALVFACAAAVLQTADPAYRPSPAQLWAPYLGAAACAAIAWFWRRSWHYGVAGLLLVLGNIHLVRVLAGDWLRARGLSELHLVCLGLCLSLAQVSALRWRVRGDAVVAVLNQSSLVLAVVILGLLSANYVGAPNLEAFTPLRFAVSGVLAWLAGVYFRRAARHPGPGEAAYVDHLEGLYHYGIVVALWCAALLVPGLSHPALALPVLSLPLFYFYARAEVGHRRPQPEGRRYRHSAAVLGFMVLALYVFRSVAQMVMFPDVPIATRHYHQNAALLMGVSLVLLRLHGLGGTGWLAFYGGLGLMGGSYFLLTALPGLSPFDRPLPAAWMAILAAQFWIVLSYERSPLRTAIQRLAGLDDTAWHRLRRSWGICLLVAVHGAGAWGLFDSSARSELVAPLVAGVASVIVHQGILRQSPVYLAIGGLELLLALHVDFLMPSWLDQRHIVWVLLALLASLRAGDLLKPAWVAAVRPGAAALVLGTMVFAHALHHRPWSDTGLWAVALLALLAASHPLRADAGGAVEACVRACARLLPVAPVWLVYFSQAPLAELGVDGAVRAWPLLTTAVALFLTGLAAERYQTRGAARYRAWRRGPPFLVDRMLAQFEAHGVRLHVTTLGVAVGVAVAVQVAGYQQPFAPREWWVLVALYAGSALAWWRRAQTARSLASSFLMQLCVAGVLAAVRRQWMLTTDLWSYEYDVWASLGVSVLLTGARDLLERQPQPLARSLLTSLCVLPLLAMLWVVAHGLGANLALLVVGLHSMMFAYLGRNDRESPFTLVALGGFVLFVLLTFWTKLHVHAVHAYVIPVGLGVLALVHLLRERMAPATRNAVRLVTMLAMLGSSGYYALADLRYPVAFNLTLILLCLLAMGLGSLLSVRIYLALGFTGLLVALGNLLVRALVHAERSVRMTVVGSLVLVIGATLVFGAIYCKTNRDRIEAWLARWRATFGAWE
ncbi:MAG: hypothetical protein JXQ71_00985 [Verrucomicrobia bacterium]|nr:hypothetical protein [Verrucomicrobiota bacterium]